MNSATPEQKSAIKTLATCLRDAGVDLVKGKPKVKLQPNQAQISIIINGEQQAIDLDFDSGDVTYEYFTTKKPLGNVNDHGLTDGIKKAFFKENDIVPNEDPKLEIIKEQIKIYIRKYLEEMSCTGTGASFSGGSGENFATPNAFVGGSAKNPKKKKYMVSKKLTW